MNKCALCLLATVTLTSSVGVADEETALDRYVAKRDASYGFFRYHSESEPLYTTYFVHLTSQTWRSSTEVDRTLWEHDLIITVPRSLAHKDTVILLVNGGHNTPESQWPRGTEQQTWQLAVALQTVVAMVRQVPNQPLFFADDAGRSRSEDEILAYSFDKFLLTGDEEWPVHLAMTKAVVKAMEATEAAMKQKLGIANVRFIISGGSKRGWTTWLAAAVDAAQSPAAQRVRAIIPASIDLLNLDRQNTHQWEAYGFYPPALNDYVAFDIPCRSRSPEGADLARIVDPYAYRARLTVPKLIANAAGDQFFLPDSSRLYFGNLPEPKLLRYAPNTDHGQSADVIVSAAAWVEALLDGDTGPQFDWTFEEDGSIRVQTITPPDRVRLWQATNPNARDFRLEAIGPVWTATDLESMGNGVFVGHVPPPPKGWTAFLVELTFASASVLEPAQVDTTDVRVVPDTLPFAGTQCSPTEPTKIGVRRAGIWLLDLNGNGLWDGPSVDARSTFGRGSDASAVGDWDGDGFSDLGILRSGQFRLDLNGNRHWDGCAVDGCFAFGAAGDVPVIGDWNGDRRSDIGVFRDGVFRLDLNGNRRWDDAERAFGRTGDLPVAGDWNRDGFTDIGVFRAGRFLLDYNKNRRWDGCRVDRCYRFGKAGDVPVAGDWNNDAAGDGIGIRRGVRWLMDRNDNGVWERCVTDLCVPKFGWKTDVPVSGRWARHPPLAPLSNAVRLPKGRTARAIGGVVRQPNYSYHAARSD
jgi:PhoPQ-activated pathogenicity-related protein